jgi:hypothetical protein
MTHVLQELQNQLQQMSFRNLILEGQDICSALISSLINRSGRMRYILCYCHALLYKNSGLFLEEREK